MDEKFQDRIDDYLLGRMDEADKEDFLHEVEQDTDKKEQLEFTRTVKNAICSREVKLQALAEFRKEYENRQRVAAFTATGTDGACDYRTPSLKEEPVHPKKRTWLWLSGVAAVLIAGFFAVRALFDVNSLSNQEEFLMENVRGVNEVFSPLAADSVDNDTIEPFKKNDK